MARGRLGWRRPSSRDALLVARDRLRAAGAIVTRAPRVAVFVVGAPGAGKTTLIREAFLRNALPTPTIHEKPKWTLAPDLFRDDGVCLAGHYTGATFDGADTVPYNGAAAALEYWSAHLLEHYRVTIFDGDRFSNRSALERVAKHADVRAAYLAIDAPTLAARRRFRGTDQNAAWVRGRETKAARFCQLLGVGYVIDAGAPLDEQAAALRELAGFE